jgi:hypothetical protein
MNGRDPLLPLNHNGGPPIEDPEDLQEFAEHVPEWGDGEACTYFQWKTAVQRARKGAPHDIVMFRLSRAEAAGVDYETYVTHLLERGRHTQAGDDLSTLQNRWKTRKKVVLKPL